MSNLASKRTNEQLDQLIGRLNRLTSELIIESTDENLSVPLIHMLEKQGKDLIAAGEAVLKNLEKNCDFRIR